MNVCEFKSSAKRSGLKFPRSDVKDWYQVIGKWRLKLFPLKVVQPKIKFNGALNFFIK